MNHQTKTFSSLFLNKENFFGIILVSVSFRQPYFYICFFRILSLYLFMLWLILCISFLLFLSIIFCYFFNAFWLHLIFFFLVILTITTFITHLSYWEKNLYNRILRYIYCIIFAVILKMNSIITTFNRNNSNVI